MENSGKIYSGELNLKSGIVLLFLKFSRPIFMNEFIFLIFLIVLAAYFDPGTATNGKKLTENSFFLLCK